MKELTRIAADEGAIPLSFVAATAEQTYINLGDALSPVMVSLMSGLPCTHMAHDSPRPRLAAVGTIAQNLDKGGDVWVWGTGSSRYANPLAPAGVEKELFKPGPRSRFRVLATRGPVTRAILGEANATGPAVYGDPVWLLPQFYRPQVKKRWKLGVIIHLADLADRSTTANPKPELVRYALSPEEAQDIVLINTVTEPSVAAMQERLDLILSCERIVSTSLHGMVFAESYGIPCLYFAVRGKTPGLSTVQFGDDRAIDLRFADLYGGLGHTSIPVYVQDRRTRTDWQDVMRAVDSAWQPTAFDSGPLIERFPLPYKPVEAKAGASIFDDPLIRAVPIRGGQTTTPRRQKAASLFNALPRLFSGRSKKD